jgi:hypothetical protein
VFLFPTQEEEKNRARGERIFVLLDARAACTASAFTLSLSLCAWKRGETFCEVHFSKFEKLNFPHKQTKEMAPLPLVAGDALVKLIASARSFRHNNPRGFFLTLSFASLSLLFLLTATHYSDSFSSPTGGVGTKDDEDAVLSYEDEDDDEKRTREKTNVENNYYEKRSESNFLWWEGAANVALACACAATIGILVAARRARKIFLLSSSSSQQQRVEGQSATAGIGKESGGGSVGKSWNGSQWVEATTAPSVLSSPYRNSSGGAAAAAARPPDANWAKAKGPGAWSSENGSNNNSNNNEDDGTDFATGFGYSEGVSSETARERAYRETLWARREAEELEAEENEEDQRNHHEYFTKHDDVDDDNGHRNRSNSSRKSSASTSSAPRKEKESAAAKRERRWSKFDQRWESLDASAATSRLPLTYNDIPWPPKMAKLLDRKVSEHEKKSSSSSSSSAGGGSDAAATKKKIYRELLLRWHPDKFMQKYGKRVRAGGDEDRIKERVDAVAKALSASMAS